MRAQRILRNHPLGLAQEMRYLFSTFCNQRNGYPRPLVRMWLNRFRRELLANPNLLRIRGRRNDDHQMGRNRVRGEEDGPGLEDDGVEVEVRGREAERQLGMDRLREEGHGGLEVRGRAVVDGAERGIGMDRLQDDAEERQIQTRPLENRKKVLLIPYVVGVSDQLRAIGNRYQLKSWFSYSGKIADNFTASFKDSTHISKRKYSVYKAVCSCGEKYIGESERNLKVRISEHKSNSSNSTLSVHLRQGRGHTLEENRTEIVLYEKQFWKRKFLESLAILYSSENLCNAGPSVRVSSMWFASVPKIRLSLT